MMFAPSKSMSSNSKMTGGSNTLALLTTLTMLRLMAAAFSCGMPTTPPSSSTPRKMLPPNPFANEQMVSNVSAPGAFPHRLNSMEGVSPNERWLVSSVVSMASLPARVLYYTFLLARFGAIWRDLARFGAIWSSRYPFAFSWRGAIMSNDLLHCDNGDGFALARSRAGRWQSGGACSICSS